MIATKVNIGDIKSEIITSSSIVESLFLDVFETITVLCCAGERDKANIGWR